MQHSDDDLFPAAPAPAHSDTLAALQAYGSVLRGWAAGAALLALFIVLVRLGERLLDWKIVLREYPHPAPPAHSILYSIHNHFKFFRLNRQASSPPGKTEGSR